MSNTNTNDSDNLPELDVEFCEHENVETIYDEDDYGHEIACYVCEDCGEEVAGDPIADAYDAYVDSQINEARGK